MFRNIFSTAVEIVLFPLMVALSAIFAGAVIIHIFRNTHYNASTGWIYCPALTGTGLKGTPYTRHSFCEMGS